MGVIIIMEIAATMCFVFAACQKSRVAKTILSPITAGPPKERGNAGTQVASKNQHRKSPAGSAQRPPASLAEERGLQTLKFELRSLAFLPIGEG